LKSPRAASTTANAAYVSARESRRKLIASANRLKTITPLRPTRSATGPAMNEETRLAAVLRVSSAAMLVRGMSSRLLTYNSRNGHTMLAPVALSSMPQNNSQNWRGY
jgi:hypothetical protein